MKRTLKSLLGLAAIAVATVSGSLIASTAAHAQTTPVPTCTVQSGSIWPAQTNFYTCFPNADANRQADVLQAFQTLPKKGAGETVDKWWDVLKSQGVKVYYFKTRASANAYFNRPSTMIPLDLNPYGGQADGVFYSSTAKCGQTGYLPQLDILGNYTQVIAVAVYDECTLTGGQTPNPQLSRTATHEGAHAYDFALTSKRTSSRNIPVSSGGYSQSLNSDLTAPWTSTTTAAKNSYICAYFSSVSTLIPSSTLETNLGATATVSICNGLLPVSPYLWQDSPPLTGKTPTQIRQERIPYFLAARENWAEAFAVRQLGIGDNQGSSFLRLTDHILGWGNAAPTRAFNCTKVIVDKYVTTGAPPIPADFTAASCTVPSGLLK